MGMQNDQFLNLMDNALLPRQLDQDNLSNYANLIMGGAQLGQQSTGKNTATPGIVPAYLGTMSTIAGLGRGMSGGGMGGAR